VHGIVLEEIGEITEPRQIVHGHHLDVRQSQCPA
jgi:hypothetical protein